jgi:trans-aconitate 2-methyltransferase
MKASYFLLYLLVGMTMTSSATREWKSDYHKQSESQFQVGIQAFEDIPLKGTERILDVGCGTGRTTHYFAQKLPQATMVGIDLSHDMIAFAQKEFGETPNLSFERHDATQMPFQDEFDVVISFYCLHWVDQKQKAVQNIADALKPGGKAYLYISFASDLYLTWRACINEISVEYPHWAPHISDDGRMRSLDEWIALAQNAGLEVINHRMFEKVSEYPTMADFKKHAMALGFVDLPDDEKSAFLDVLLPRFYQRLGITQDELFHFNPTTLMLEVTKK